MRSQDNQQIELKWLCSEFTVLRREIDRRSKEQYLCISGSVVSIGASAAFISENIDERWPLICVLPWLLTIFATLWATNAVAIKNLGSYVQEVIEVRIRGQVLSERPSLGWEHRNVMSRNKAPRPVLALKVGVFCVLPSAKYRGSRSHVPLTLGDSFWSLVRGRAINASICSWRGACLIVTAGFYVLLAFVAVKAWNNMNAGLADERFQSGTSANRDPGRRS